MINFGQPYLLCSVAEQTLQLREGEQLLQEYRVSTAKNGVGEVYGSEQTPRGRHQIRAKVGAAVPANTVFIARRPTGEIYSPQLRLAEPGRDWILTRIMWLSGLEPGKNRFGDRDTMKRMVYIHGAPDEASMGAPGSKGCIRMRNADIIELFDRISAGTRLLIS